MKNEKTTKPLSGYIMLPIVLLALIAAFITQHPLIIVPVSIICMFCLMGFMIIYPNTSKVLTLFGSYVGTVKEDGFYWANPFYAKKSINLRARNFDSERLKVNDKRGNPIVISVILVWRVSDTFKAAFEVDDFAAFVKVQTDSAVRKLTGMYSYDNFDDDQSEITLRSAVEEVNNSLEKEIQERLQIGGIEVLEVRIGYLAYAPEIAAAMLKRQQAEAIVAARHKIVEGAVSMVEGAINQIGEKNIVHLNSDQKANMVSNLMVVLCSDKETTPIVDTGS